MSNAFKSYIFQSARVSGGLICNDDRFLLQWQFCMYLDISTISAKAATINIDSLLKSALYTPWHLCWRIQIFRVKFMVAVHVWIRQEVVIIVALPFLVFMNMQQSNFVFSQHPFGVGILMSAQLKVHFINCCLFKIRCTNWHGQFQCNFKPCIMSTRTFSQENNY